MNMLKCINNLSIDNIDEKNISDILYRIQDTLSDRKDWLELREPDSDGEVYDEWSDKYESFEEIFDEYVEFIGVYEDYINEGDTDKRDILLSDLIDSLIEVQVDIQSFQEIYGGLSKLKLIEKVS